MKRLCCVLLVMCMFFAMLPSALATGGMTMYIRPLQSYDSRLKLRETPTSSGRILGQYYAGTAVYVLDYNAIYHGEVLEDWARVTIGDVEGYMMSAYLTTNLPSEYTWGEILPMNGEEATLWDADGNEIDYLSAGPVQVLGTLDNDTVHVLADWDDGTEYGYLSAQEVSWADENQYARVRALKATDLVPVRVSPQAGSEVVCSLYPGTEVIVLFSDSTANAGWKRIRVGQMTGYILDPYLDHSNDEFPFYRPQPAQLRTGSAPVSDGTTDTVYREDLLFVLGRRSGTITEYLCQFGVWENGGRTYTVHYGFVPRFMVILKEPGGVPAKGMLKKGSVLYQINSLGNMVAMANPSGSDDRYPMGTEFYIAYGLDDAMRREGGLETGYITQDTAWVYVELRVPEKYKGLQGYLPLDKVYYDKRLLLPGSATGG